MKDKFNILSTEVNNLKASNKRIECSWIRSESFDNRSAALNKSNRLGLLAGRTSKVEYDSNTNLYWLCLLSGKPVVKNINQELNI